jgi:hypothetical protein
MLDDRFRALALTMGFGAIFDFAFAAAILVVPHASSTLLGIPLPDDPFYLRLVAVLLVILGAVYLLPARAPERFHAIAPISASGRVLGFVLFALAWSHGRPPAFLALGLTDLALALVTLAAWARARAASPSR